MRTRTLVAAAALAALTVAAAQQPARVSTAAEGAFVAHAEHIQPGAKLFVAYNCVDCHGADGSGAMGPSLADGRWHFGGGAAELFESIYQGRPDGMPAWGSLIDRDQIWRLVAYVQSLDARAADVTTENFTGATVERTGH